MREEEEAWRLGRERERERPLHLLCCTKMALTEGTEQREWTCLLNNCFRLKREMLRQMRNGSYCSETEAVVRPPLNERGGREGGKRRKEKGK